MFLSRRAGRMLRGVGAVADRFLSRHSSWAQAVQLCSLIRVLSVIDLWYDLLDPNPRRAEFMLVAAGRAVRTILARGNFLDGRCHLLLNLSVMRVSPDASSS